MQATPEQLGAYYLWLKDRGVRFPARRVGALPGPAPVVVPLVATPKKKLKVAFVGDQAFTGEERALLDKMIAAMQLAGPSEVLEQADAWKAFAEAHDTELVITLGARATTRFLGDAAFESVRGRFARPTDSSADVLPTLHPMDLLLRPEDKRVAWNDLKLAMARLNQ